jgi:hypothetical protein
MDVEVISKLKQATFGAFVTSSLVGDSLPVRVRSASIGILGLVAAVGLSLTAVVSQQGWPGALSAPLPQPPQLVQNDSIAAPGVGSAGGHGASRYGAGAAHRFSGADSRLTPPSIGAGGGGAVTGGGPLTASPPRPSHPSRPQEPAPTVVPQVPPGEDTPTGGSKEPEAPSSGGGSPGQSGEPHGHSGEPHGHSGEPHGHSGEAPGHTAGGPPGQSGNPGRSWH